MKRVEREAWLVLFHGSNVEVCVPRLLTPNRALDFVRVFATEGDRYILGDVEEFLYSAESVPHERKS